MGNPLSILLATSLCIASVYSWDGKCLPAEEKATEMTERRCAGIGDPVPCDADELCRWSEPAEVEAAPRRARAGAAKTPEKLAKSLTAVRHEGGWLKKDLPPIEAVTEMIGDYVVYKVLKHHMPDEYDEVLSAMNIDAMSKMNSVTASDYKPLPLGETLPEKCVQKSRLSIKKATDTERASKKNPMQSVLRYSRPYLRKVEPFLTDEKLKKITMDTYTLNALIATILTTFIDNYIGNTDRYIGVSSEIVPKGILGINYNNIMLYNLDDKWVYVPIDQGFARTVTFTWFKTLGMSDNRDCDAMLEKAGVAEKDIRERAYKQLLFSDTWLSGTPEDKSNAGKWWNAVYAHWLYHPDKAQHFVEENQLLFPTEIYLSTNKHLKEQIIEIVDVVWNVMGPVLCDELNKEIKGSFDKIHKKEEGRSTVLPLLRKDKTKADKEDAQNIFETQWNIVIEAMDKQANACAEWSEKMDQSKEWRPYLLGAVKQWTAIEKQLKDRPLLRDFLSSKDAKAATVSDSELRRQQSLQAALDALALAGSASFSEYSFSSSELLTSLITHSSEYDDAHTVPYGDDFHLNMYSNDDPRMKPPYPSSHSDHDVKQPRYLWMFLMATVIVCGCFAIYSLWCIVNSVLCGILCYAKLLSSSRLWPWSTEQRVVCADEDYTSAV